MKELVQKAVNKITDGTGKVIGFILGFILGYIQSEYAAFIQLKNMLHTRRQFEHRHDNHAEWLDFEMEGKSFHVYKNVYMNEIGVHYACVLGGCFTHLKKNINIEVDEHFFSISKNAQMFFLRHEAGHILNKDFSYGKMKSFQKEYAKNLKNGMPQDEAEMITAMRRMDDEFMADKRAMDEIGKESALLAMEEVYRIMQLNEVKQRYKNLGGDTKNLRTNTLWRDISVKCTRVSLDEIE